MSKQKVRVKIEDGKKIIVGGRNVIKGDILGTGTIFRFSLKQKVKDYDRGQYSLPDQFPNLATEGADVDVEIKEGTDIDVAGGDVVHFAKVVSKPLDELTNLLKANLTL